MTVVEWPQEPERDVCGSCGEPIWWLAHERTGKPAPIEVKLSEAGNVRCDWKAGTYGIVSKADRPNWKLLHLNHFATCRAANVWRKAGKTP